MIRVLSFGVVLVAAAVSLATSAQLPEVMAIHWNAYGRADGFAPKAIAVWAMPGVMLALFGLFAALAGRARGASRGAFEAVAFATQVFLLFIHAMIIAIGFGHPLHVERVVPFGISVLFVVIGFFMPGLTPNPVMGIRTPWTLKSATVWRVTHRFAGRLFVLGGAALALVSAVGVPFWVVLAGFMVLGLAPAAYSFAAFRRYSV